MQDIKIKLKMPKMNKEEMNRCVARLYGHYDFADFSKEYMQKVLDKQKAAAKQDKLAAAVVNSM